MALISIEFKDNDFKKIMEDLRTAEELTFKAHRNLSALGVVSVGADPKRDEIPQDLQEALNEEFLTDPQTLKCHSETIQGLIVNPSWVQA